MKNRRMLVTLALMTLALPLAACGKAEPTLLIPIGRTSVAGEGSFEVSLDSQPQDAEVEYDSYGGYWARVPVVLQENASISIRFTIVDRAPEPFRDEQENIERWLQPSRWINSDDLALIEKAHELTKHIDGTIDKASRIHAFVVDYLEFEPIRGHSFLRASQTFEMGRGTCVNHARLFVALCRIAGVPARTVWGVIYDGGVYDHNHEWAEVMDDEGYWHPLDLTFTTSFDFADIRYLDLIYAAEENVLYSKSKTWSYKLALNDGEIIVYDSTLIPSDGRLGFQVVSDDRPSSITVKNRFKIGDLPELVPHK